MLASASLLSVNGTLIAEAIAFLLMVLILWRWVYPRVIQMAEQRERAIEAGLQPTKEFMRQRRQKKKRTSDE